MKASKIILLFSSFLCLTVSLTVLMWMQLSQATLSTLGVVFIALSGFLGLAGISYLSSLSLSRKEVPEQPKLRQLKAPQHSKTKKAVQNHFELIAENSREIACLLEPGLVMSYVSPAIEHVLGYHPEELIGKTPFQVSIPENIEEQLQGQDEKPRYHFLMKNKAGQDVWLEAELKFLHTQNKQKPDRLLVFLSEITAYKKQTQILEQMQQLANIGSWEYSLESKNFFVTDQVARLFDVTFNCQEPKSFDEIVEIFHPESQTIIHREFKQAIDYEKSWDLELSFVDRKGKTRWIRTVGSPYSRNGKVYKFAGTIQDITEHIAFEELIIKKQNELKVFVENTPVSVAMFDENLCYIAASYQWCETYNLKQESLKGRYCYDTIPHFPEEWREMHQRCLNGEPILREEDTIRNKNGQIEWIKWEARPWHDENGNIRGLIMFTQNIGEQKKQAEMARKQQKRMEEIYRIASDNSGSFSGQLHQMLRIATWALNMEHGVFHKIKKDHAYVIDAYSVNDLFKSEEKNPLKDSYASVSYQLDKLLAIPHMSQSAFCALPCYNNYKLEAYIGVPVWVRGERYGTLDFMASSPLSENFQQADKDFVQLLGQWISSALERQQYEQELIISKEKAEEASKAKEQFLSVMSHEIRTPMNAVVGISHLLLQEDPKPEQVESLNTLQFSANNLLALINDILDFSKIEAGKIDLENIDFNLLDLLQKQKRLMMPTARERGIELFFNIDEQVKEMVKGDSVRLNQILTNLLSNAIKFTPEGHVKLTVRQKNVTSKYIFLEFEVSDTGIGIPQDKLEIIFESFSQASTDTTRKYGGTGLGLAITKKLIDLQKGSIKVKSEINKGTSFTVELPFEKASKQIQPRMKVAASSAQALKGLNILLVEDQEINQFVAKRFLDKWGVNCDMANNGLEGLEKAKNQTYDVILMDLQMPEMDGFEACRKIRELQEPYFQHVPILALTAAALSGVKQSVLQAGMNDHISKPFDPTELYEKLQKFSARMEDKLIIEE
jgi:PAS domain S-box-containing protein